MIRTLKRLSCEVIKLSNIKEFHEIDGHDHVFSELGEYMPKAECCGGNTFLYMCSDVPILLYREFKNRTIEDIANLDYSVEDLEFIARKFLFNRQTIMELAMDQSEYPITINAEDDYISKYMKYKKYKIGGEII